MRRKDRSLVAVNFDVVSPRQIYGETKWERAEYKRIVLARCATELARDVMQNEFKRWLGKNGHHKFGPGVTAGSLTNREVSAVSLNDNSRLGGPRTKKISA